MQGCVYSEPAYISDPEAGCCPSSGFHLKFPVTLSLLLSGVNGDIQGPTFPLCHLLSNTDNFIENPKEKRPQPLGHSRAVLFHCRQGLRCGTVWRTLYSLHLMFTCFPAAPTDFESHFWRFHIRSSWWISLHSSWPVWLPTTFNDSEKYCNEHLYKCRLSLFKNDTRWFTRGKKNWPA